VSADITEWLTEMAGHLTNAECVDPECADCAAGRTLIAAADEIERLRAAGDALYKALNDNIMWTGLDEINAVWREARRSAEDHADNRSALIDAHHVLTSEDK
jgi:hypothetical protein